MIPFKRSRWLTAAYALAVTSAMPSTLSAAEYNYAEALQKSIYFYEAQQSGTIPDWNRNEWRGDSGLEDGSDNGVDLTGGWYDAGDHVKFGFPMAASATMLAWGVVEYPEAYSNSGQLEHIQNNLRFVADYFMKAHTDTNELYGQVGSGSVDHAWWGSAEVMQMERPSYKITESCPGTDLAGETAAALAAISMVFADSDADYAEELLTHAKELYDFAYADGDESGRGVYSDCITDASSFYNSWSGYNDELVWSALWLYRATNDDAYLTNAKADYDNLSTENQTTTKSYKWTQAWDDKSYGSYVLMAALVGGDEYEADAERWLDYWSSGYNGEKITYTDGGLAYLDTWGANRYAANTAFIALIYSDYLKSKDSSDSKATTYYDFALSQIDYILGDNPNDISYLIGFGDNYPQNPHHRTSHGSWTDSQTNPTESRHSLVGALVGGPSSDDSYEDERSNYINNEVATDYNSGFTGAVARLSMDFSGSTLSDFPVAEEKDTEFRVQAKLNSSGSNYAEIAMHVQNMSAWPAREADNLRARYYVDISEAIDAGYSASDITVSTAYSQATSVSDLILVEGTTYYVEVSFEGINIYPGGQSAYYKEVQLRIAGPTGTSFWDSTNDPSWGSFTGSEYIDASGIPLIDADDDTVLWGTGYEETVECETNCAPTANNLTVVTTEGEAVDITLSGSDKDGSIATYTVTSEPANGVLTGTAAARVYTPATGFTGSDSFSYTVTDDDSATSEAATVTITVNEESVEVPVDDTDTDTDTGSDTDTDTDTDTGSDTDTDTDTDTSTSGLSCSISKVDSWNSGFVMNNIIVTNNTGAAITSWDVQIQLEGSDIAIVNSWNASVSLDADNVLTASNVSYNGSLAEGGTANFGLQGSFSGDWSDPVCIVEGSDDSVTDPDTDTDTGTDPDSDTDTDTDTDNDSNSDTEITDGLTCSDGQADIWDGGVVLNNYTVTNTSSETLTEWSVDLDFGNTVTVSNIWNASAETNGDIVTVSGTNLSAGQSVTFGFQGAYSGSIETPSCVTESDSTDNGSTDDGSTDNGSTDDGSTDDGSTDDGSTDNGSTDDGSTDDGSTDDGSTDNGSTDDGSTDDGSTDDGSTDDGSTDETSTGVFRINDDGKLTQAGEVIPMNCVSWFGLEGQFEPKDAANNPGGAPMEMYVGNMWWANSGQGTGRTIESTMQEIVDLGVNLIRVPIAPQTLDETNEQGIGDIQSGGVLKNHESVRQLNSRQALTDFIQTADDYGVNVIIDIHSCSNYLGWRAGDLEATPPYVDADREDYDYTREDYSCSYDGVGSDVTVHEYNEEIWKENLAEIAGLSEELGVDNIVGIDIFNEPWNYTWTEWKALAESAYETISAVNDDMVIIVEGIGSGKADGTEVEHGSEDFAPNWGENLYGFAENPLDIPKDRLILSPHTYGPSVYVQNHFLDQTQAGCEDLEGDEAGEAGCDIVIDPDYLAQGWDEHFGYLREQGYAVLIGEFGGLMDWPLSAETYYANLWSHVSSTVDKEWQTALVDYMDENGIEGCYWSLNPESADTGGLFEHAYDADSNAAGWGEWLDIDTDKLSLLEKLWQ